MRPGFFLRRAPFVVAAIVASTSVTSCAHPYEYADTAHNDRHRWDSREDAAYRRWEAERRVDHLEFARRNEEEQRTYWTWRHSHPD
jgi:hypothetical protein